MSVSRFADLNNPYVFDELRRKKMQEKLAQIADRQTQRDVAAAYGQIIPFNSNDFLGYA